MTEPQFTMPRDMSGFSDLEAAMLEEIHAGGLPEPAIELHFAWCCEHAERVHRDLEPGEPCCFRCQEQAIGRRWWGDGYYHLHVFRRDRDWRFDFAWPDRMVALEVEGGTWSEGRHTRGGGFEDDCRKYAEATLRGWRVLRVTSGMVTRGEARELVERALECQAARR